jgi:8-oxo-dGTP pyrophosphatase MutT (NUDIX family)
MHSIAMSSAARNILAWRSISRPQLRALDPDRKSIRVSDLHKLRRCKQVAAVCYRIRREKIEFLMVQTRGKGRWTFPKGCTEPGLTHAQAAALEAFEEAGVHGRIEEAAFARYVLGSAKTSSSALKSREISAHLCQVLGLGAPKEANRNRTWFSMEEAKLRLCEGRKPEDKAEFLRVLEKAVARIDAIRQSTRSRLPSAPRWDALQFDTLQRVQFEAPNRPAFASTRISAAVKKPDQFSIQQDDFSPLPARRPRIFPIVRNLKALGTGSR